MLEFADFRGGGGGWGHYCCVGRMRLRGFVGFVRRLGVAALWRSADAGAQGLVLEWGPVVVMVILGNILSNAQIYLADDAIDSNCEVRTVIWTTGGWRLGTVVPSKQLYPRVV